MYVFIFREENSFYLIYLNNISHFVWFKIIVLNNIFHCVSYFSVSQWLSYSFHEDSRRLSFIVPQLFCMANCYKNMVTLLKIVLVTVILAVMVLILLGIGHLFSGDFSATEDDTKSLRKDVDTRRDVITDESAFSSLVRQSKKIKESHSV